MSTVSTNPMCHDIIARMIEANGRPISEELAQYVIEFDFDESERKHVNWLCAQNRTGEISDEDSAELEEFIRFGDFLSLMKAKAIETLTSGNQQRDG